MNKPVFKSSDALGGGGGGGEEGEGEEKDAKASN